MYIKKWIKKLIMDVSDNIYIAYPTVSFVCYGRYILSGNILDVYMVVQYFSRELFLVDKDFFLLQSRLLHSPASF